MTIPKLEVKGETLINVPTDKLILLELGLSENEATVAIEQYEQQQELKIKFLLVYVSAYINADWKNPVT